MNYNQSYFSLKYLSSWISLTLNIKGKESLTKLFIMPKKQQLGILLNLKDSRLPLNYLNK